MIALVVAMVAACGVSRDVGVVPGLAWSPRISSPGRMIVMATLSPLVVVFGQIRGRGVAMSVSSVLPM